MKIETRTGSARIRAFILSAFLSTYAFEIAGLAQAQNTPPKDQEEGFAIESIHQSKFTGLSSESLPRSDNARFSGRIPVGSMEASWLCRLRRRWRSGAQC